MDLNQVTQLLTWLDEEHRKDKALLMALQSQIDTHKAQLTEQARQLQEIQAALTRIEGQLPKLTQLESSIQSVRTEFTGLLAKQAAEQDTRQEQRLRAEKLESETMARLVRQLQEQVESLGSFDSSVALLRDEDGKLQAELTKVFTHLADMSKRLNAEGERIGVLSQVGQTLREGLANARLSNEDLRSQSMALKAALEALGPRLDTKIEQLQSSIEDISKKRQVDLEPLQVKQQEQARLLEELGKETRAVQIPINRWAKQMEEFTAQFEHNRKTLYDLHEAERQMRQQGNELLELQRVTAERQRAELREWQDNQVKVDEEQTVRLEQLEAWQRKTSEALQELEVRLQESRQDIATYANELWQAWSAFVREQVKAFGNLKQRKAG